MASRSRTLFVIALGAALAAPAARAQDGAQPPVPTAPASGTAAALRKMETLYPKALDDPRASAPGPEADDKTKGAYGMRLDAWHAAVKALDKAGDEYMSALADAAPDARALFLRGAGKALAIRSGDVGGQTRAYADIARDALQRYLDAAGEKAEYRVDAEAYLVAALVSAGRLDDLVEPARRAVEHLQKDGRHEDAGRTADSVMQQLIAAHRDADLKAFVDATHAADADFGGWTDGIRKYVSLAAFSVGSPLPALPAVKDVDGKPISFAADGKPLLIHFFHTSIPGGLPASSRDFDAVIRPLWDSTHEKGVRFVGVCMDDAMSPAKAEQMRKNWEEWGRKEEFRDGSLESCRKWAEKHGLKWTWYWDGQWLKDPISVALGGVAASAPYAVLVDGKGVVRWKGDAPFDGLADEVGKLIQ